MSMRYRLRSLLMVLIFAPPVLAGLWFAALRAAAVLPRIRSEVAAHDWDDVAPLFERAGAIALLFAVATVGFALARRAGGSN
jgi:hypothetical protein